MPRTNALRRWHMSTVEHKIYANSSTGEDCGNNAAGTEELRILRTLLRILRKRGQLARETRLLEAGVESFGRSWLDGVRMNVVANLELGILQTKRI